MKVFNGYMYMYVCINISTNVPDHLINPWSLFPNEVALVLIDRSRNISCKINTKKYKVDIIQNKTYLLNNIATCMYLNYDWHWICLTMHLKEAIILTLKTIKWVYISTHKGQARFNINFYVTIDKD